MQSLTNGLYKKNWANQLRIGSQIKTHIRSRGWNLKIKQAIFSLATIRVDGQLKQFYDALNTITEFSVRFFL